MVYGAEFGAETHALRCGVKSRNTQVPEHYPHMPMADPYAGDSTILRYNGIAFAWVCRLVYKPSACTRMTCPS